MTKSLRDDSNREIEILSVALGITEKELMKILQKEGYDPFWELHTFIAMDLLKSYVGEKELKAFRKNRRIFDKIKRQLLKSSKVKNNPKKISLPVSEIIEKYQSGKSSIELADEYGVNQSTIFKLLKRKGVEIRGRKINLPVSEIIEKYLSGKTSYELADEYGVNQSTIINLLKREGVERRSLKINLPVSEIIKKYQSGKSSNELADEYGVSKPTIRRLLKREGVEIRAAGIPKINLPVSEIIEKYLSGKTSYELADEYDATQTSIIRLLKREGVERRTSRAGIKISAREKQLQTKAKKKKLNVGAAPKVLRKILEKSGLSVEHLDDIVVDYYAGQTIKEISENYGLPENVIINFLKDSGVNIKSNPRGKIFDDSRVNKEIVFLSKKYKIAENAVWKMLLNRGFDKFYALQKPAELKLFLDASMIKKVVKNWDVFQQLTRELAKRKTA